MRTRPILGGAAALALAAGLVMLAFREDPVPVDLATVERGPMAVVVEAEGKTRIREVYEIAAPISGIARRSPVHVGDRVTGGESVVAVVEPAAPTLLDERTRSQAEAAVREARAAVAVAESRLAQAGEDLSYAQGQYDRTSALVDRGVASFTALEAADQALKVSRAAEAAARSGLDLARSTLERAEAALIEPGTGATAGACCVSIRAPADGVVLSLAVESEMPVAAGTPLLSIGDPDDLEIVADLLSADAVRLPDGASARVDRWGGPEFAARLARVDPVAVTRVSALGIEEQRVDAVFEIVSPPEARAGLGHGYAVYLHVDEWRTDDALLVPVSALFRRGGDWAVYGVEDGIAREIPVEIGRRNARVAEVLGGIEAGARVVTHPGGGVADGAAVAERD